MHCLERKSKNASYLQPELFQRKEKSLKNKKICNQENHVIFQKRCCVTNCKQNPALYDNTLNHRQNRAMDSIQAINALKTPPTIMLLEFDRKKLLKQSREHDSPKKNPFLFENGKNSLAEKIKAFASNLQRNSPEEI